MKKKLQFFYLRIFYKILSVYALFIIGFSVNAQIIGDPAMDGNPEKVTNLQKSSQKVSEKLQNLVTSSSSSGRFALKQKPDWQNTNNNLLQFRDNGKSVLVDIVAIGDVNTLKTQLERKGMIVYAVFGNVISGAYPVNKISDLENMKGLGLAKPSFKPRLEIGIVTSEGDKAQRSDIARLKSGADGLGVKVGIISDSYNSLKSADIGIKSGDLPGIGNPDKWFNPVEVLSDLDSNGTDEGRGMAEIVHDVAPGASLAFHTAYKGEADFAQGIIRLADAGCQVIVDDVSYFDEPFFQDGIIAQAVDKVRARGVTYFSAAGNEGQRSYESKYRPSNISPAPLDSTFGTAHNFSDLDSTPRYLQPVYIPKGSQFILALQWDNSFLSASGVGADADIDIYLLDKTGKIVSGSADPNIGLNPSEIFGFTNNTTSNTFFIVIMKYKGVDPTRLKYILYGDGAFYLTKPRIPGILAPTLVGHAKASGAIATGAAYYKNTPAFGINPPEIESYSSKGGVFNYFDIKGNRLASPINRRKPEITAPDGGKTSFFGQFLGSDKFPSFFGTSAAAPHAAGVAAIMIEASKVDLGIFNVIRPYVIVGAMTKTAVEMHDPGLPIPGFEPTPNNKGFNFKTGHGLLNAEKAVGSVTLQPFYVFQLFVSPVCSDEPFVTRKWKITNLNFINVRTNWQLNATDQSGVLIAPPGESFFTTSTIKGLNTIIISWKDAQNEIKLASSNSTAEACNSNSTSRLSSEKKSNEVALINKPFISVSPNPTSDHFNVSFGTLSENLIELQLFNLQGNKIQNTFISNSNEIYELKASNLPAGMYLLKAVQNGKTEVVKIIKQ